MAYIVARFWCCRSSLKYLCLILLLFILYISVFPAQSPTRATFQVAKLPKDADVEIEAIALSGNVEIAVAGPCPCARQ